MKKTNKIPLPVIDTAKCTKCNLCFNICPKKAIVKASNNACAKCIKYCISMKVPCNPHYYVFCYEKCDACGLCIIACQNKAIYWHKVVDIDCSETLN